MRFSIRVSFSVLIFLFAFVLINGISAQEGPSIYERSIRSVVTIEGETSLGSGFLVAPQVVATNYHVVSGLTGAKCYFTKAGERFDVEGFLVADKLNDLVLLKVSGLTERALNLSPYNAKPGQRIYVMGSPKGLEGSISEGLVSCLRTIDGTDKIQISAPISSGSSGGPVMNINGEVIGISVLKFTGGENLNFAVPVSELKKLLVNLPSKVQELSSLPPMESEEEDVSESNDMGRAELIYDVGITDGDTPLSLDYIAHFRDSTCFYFTYDMTGAYESDPLSEYWLDDYRVIDIASGEVVKPIRSNLIGSENDPHKIYRGTKMRYSITFPRLSPSVRNFHLLEGNCDEDNFCFRNIRLRDFSTADGMDWKTYEKMEPEGTVSFFTRSNKSKFSIVLGGVNIGTLAESWKDRSNDPGCGSTSKSVLTNRLPIGKYTYKATSGDKTITGEVNVTAEGCLVVELGK